MFYPPNCHLHLFELVVFSPLRLDKNEKRKKTDGAPKQKSHFLIIHLRNNSYSLFTPLHEDACPTLGVRVNICVLEKTRDSLCFSVVHCSHPCQIQKKGQIGQ